MKIPQSFRTPWKKHSEKGFTLLELLLGIFIGAAALTTIYQFMQSSSQSVALSSQHFIALHLSGKVMADLFEESRISNTLTENSITFPDLVSRSPVVDAQSPFFQMVRDSREPWGAIQPGVDMGVTKDFGPTYNLLQPFYLQVSIRRPAPASSRDPERHLAESTIKVDWQEKSGMSRSYTIQFECPSPYGPLPEEKILIDEETLKQRVREEFFPDMPDKSLEQAISASGCDGGMLMKAGKIGVLMADLTASIASLSAEIQVLSKKRREQLQNLGPSFIETQLRISRKTETGASLLYNVLLEAAQEASSIQEQGTAGNLGKIPIVPFGKALKTFRSLSGEIDGWVRCTGEAYRYLLDESFSRVISGKTREIACMKALDAIRLRCSMGKLPVAKWKEFIDRERERVKERNPFLAKFFLREEMAVSDRKVFVEAFPNLVFTVDRIQEVIGKTASGVPEILSRHPASGGG